MRKICLLLIVLSIILLQAQEKETKSISLLNHHKIIKIEKIIIASYQYQESDKEPGKKEPDKIRIIDDKKNLNQIKELFGKINSQGSISKLWFIKERISIYILLNNNRYCELEIVNARLARVGGYGTDNLKAEKELIETFRKILKK